MSTSNNQDFRAGVAFTIDNHGMVMDGMYEIIDGLDGVQVGFKSAESAGVEAMETIASAAKISEIRALGDQITNLGQRLMNMSSGITRQIVSTGAQFGDVRRGFLLAFGDAEQANNTFERALEVAEETNLMTLDVLSNTARWSRMGVDAMRGYTGQVLNAAGVVEERMIPGLQLASDLVMGSGQASQNVFYQLTGAIRGQTMSFRALFDGLQTAQESAAHRAATTAQERADVVFGTIARLYGGISASAAGTFNFVIDNLKDVTQNILGLLGERIIPALQPVLARLFDILSAIKSDEEFLGAMADAFVFVADQAAWLGEKVLNLFEYVQDLIRTQPQLGRMAVLFGLAVPALLIMTGTFITFVAAVGGFTTFILPMLVTGFTSLFSVLGGLLPVVLAVAGAVGLIVLAWQSDFAGLQSFAERAVLAIRGIWEVLTSYMNGSASLSEETAQALEDAGLFQFVLEVGGTLGSLKDQVLQVISFIQENGGQVLDALMPMINSFESFITNTIDRVMSLLSIFFGSTVEGMNGSAKGIDGFVSGWDKVVSVLESVSSGISLSLEWLDQFFDKMQPFIEMVARVNVAISKFLVALIGESTRRGWQVLTDDILPVMISMFGSLMDLSDQLRGLFGYLRSDFIDVPLVLDRDLVRATEPRCTPILEQVPALAELISVLSRLSTKNTDDPFAMLRRGLQAKISALSRRVEQIQRILKAIEEFDVPGVFIFQGEVQSVQGISGAMKSTVGHPIDDAYVAGTVMLIDPPFAGALTGLLGVS